MDMSTSPANDTAPISVQLYSLREAAAVDFSAVLSRLGEIGFVGVELAGFHDLTPQQFAEVAAASGLTVSSAHIGDVSPDAFRASLDDLQSVGCNTVALAFLPPDAFTTIDAVKRSAEALNVAAAIAADRGVALGYHNHWWEFENQFDGKSAWSHLFALTDPSVFAELDIYWATVGGADAVALVAEYGGRVRLLHVKDGPVDDPRSAMVAVGSGAMDIGGILRAAPSAQWHVVELDRCDTDMFDAVEASYRYLTSVGLSRGRR
jgi:sugar phosphate isomerase/epimerase